MVEEYDEEATNHTSAAFAVPDPPEQSMRTRSLCRVEVSIFCSVKPSGCVTSFLLCYNFSNIGKARVVAVDVNCRVVADGTNKC